MATDDALSSNGPRGAAPRHSSGVAGTSPFSLEHDEIYRRWRDWKLEGYPTSTGNLAVEVDDPLRLSDAETGAILNICRQTNMALYAARVPAADKAIPREVGRRFGLFRLDSNLLADEDAISSLQVIAEKSGRGYIPYSNRRLLWHTDGYYNPPVNRIRAFILHCAAPAALGGENALLDHEIAYILLREASREYVRALMAPDAMTIPANTESGAATRAAQTGPVFSVDRAGNLHMRYTARTRSIQWKQDAAILEAVRCLEGILGGDSPFVFRHRLVAGQGLICNNVLHSRTAFEDDLDKGVTRLLYRARYYDRIAGTDLPNRFGGV